MTDNEVRLIIIDIQNTHDIKFVDFDYLGLIEDIMLDPKMDRNVFEQFRDYLKNQFSIKVKIHKSTLYTPKKRFNF